MLVQIVQALSTLAHPAAAAAAHPAATAHPAAAAAARPAAAAHYICAQLSLVLVISL